MKKTILNKGIALASAASLLLFSSVAGAGHKRAGDYSSQARNHFYDYAKVTDVQPVYETVVKHVPVEQCWNERVPVRDSYYDDSYRERRHSATPTLLGAIIGGAIGNELGHHKRNKQVGVVVGSLLGGSIGHDIAHQRERERDYYRHASVEYHTVERCDVENERYEERELVGYEVSYRYRGNLYTTVMDDDPGKKLRVSVNVTPLDF